MSSGSLRTCIRSLLKSRAFTCASVLILATGIGANVAIYSVVRAVLLTDLPWRDPGSLVWIWSTRVDRDKAFFSIPNLLDYQARTRTLQEMAAFGNWNASLTGQGEAERLTAARVTGNMFPMLGTRAVLGRTLDSRDAQPGADRAVVLSRDLWQRRFGSDRGLIGRTLLLDGEPHTVVGILPAGFVLPGTRAELAGALDLQSHPRRSERGSNFLRALGRIRPDVPLDRVRAEMDAITRQLRSEFPEDNGRHTMPRINLLRDEITGAYSKPLWMLFGAVGALLLITCLNVSGLFLVRATARRRELAIHSALGATRFDIVRSFLLESLLLAAAGGGLGVLLAWWGIDALVALSPVDLPRTAPIGLDAGVLAFALCLVALTCLIMGLSPALRLSRIDPSAALRSQDLPYSRRGRGAGTRRLLVVAETALSLILLIGAGLFLTSFRNLRAVEPGFNISNILVGQVSLSPRYPGTDGLGAFARNLSQKIAGLPGVRAFGLASVLPLSGLNVRTDFIIVGRPPASPEEMPGAQIRWVSPGYFQALGIPVRRGRDFTDHDLAHAPGVAAVDETLARNLWAGSDPIGAHLRLEDGTPSAREVEIVAVVGSVRNEGPASAPAATLYAPLGQVPEPALPFVASSLNLVVRTPIDPLALSSQVKRSVQNLDRDAPVSMIQTMDQLGSLWTAPGRFLAILLGFFASVGILLSAGGLYGVMAYAVSGRTSEIGIRMALGAGKWDVVRLVVLEGLGVLLAGILAGAVGAFTLNRTVSDLLFGVRAEDARTFAVMAALLLCAGLLAAYLPARKAARVDPIVALRSE